MKKKLLTILLLTTLTACDYAEKRDLRQERASRAYQEAMADYQAGRLDSAIKGFQKIVRDEPSNSAARFQFACLLLDVRKDYQGAFCAFQEYLLQHPESDKARMARERCEICAREMAREMAERYGLTKTQGLTIEIETLKAKLKEVNDQKATLQRELEVEQKRANGLATEREKLLAMIRGEGTEDTERPQITEVRDLLNEADEEENLKPLVNETELKAVRNDDSDVERVEAPVAVGSTTGGKAASPAPAPSVPDGPQHEKRPKFYTVQEGDTLIRIAIRFYGRPSAWHQIHEANKVVISSDAKVRAGTVIKLP